MLERFLCLMITCLISSPAFAILQPGDEAAKILTELGEPSGQIKVGSKTVYSYPQGVIHVKNGQVTHVSEGFYETINQFSRKTKEGAVIDLDRSDPNLIAPQNESVNAQSSKAGWLTDYDQAAQTSTSKGKAMLMLFTGADGCVKCQHLEDEVFSQAEFKDYALQELVLLKVDFSRSHAQSQDEMDRNESLKKQWVVDEFPVLVILDSQQLELGRTGYTGVTASDYVIHLSRIINMEVDENKDEKEFLRSVVGDDLADALEQLEFLDGISGSAVSLSIQSVLASILMFYIIRRVVRR